MTRIPVTARDILPGDVIDGDTVTYTRTLRMGYVIVKSCTLTGNEKTATYEAGRKVVVRREGGR